MRYSILCAVAALALLTASNVLAQAPSTLSFQGFVTDSAGANLNKPTVSIVFKLYDGGVEVWSENHPVVTVEDGVFDVLLGETTPLDTVAFNAQMELGITVGSDSEISPRTPLAAAAYAKALPGLYTFYRDKGNGFRSHNVVGGAANNVVGSTVIGATIGGGGGISSGLAVPNRVLEDFGTVSGGFENLAGGFGATIAGGSSNAATFSWATVGGGSSNTASLFFATVGGGSSNTAGDQGATVGGGISNIASGSNSTVPGGVENAARGLASFAAGHDAKANHDGTFVWNDVSILTDNDSLVSTGPNQFLIRAAGGVGIGTNEPGSPLTVAGIIESTTGGFMFPDNSVQTTAAGPSAQWGLTGNAGTTPGANFIGTTDTAAFVVKVNDTRAMRIQYAEDSAWIGVNLIGGHSTNAVPAGVVGATISGGGVFLKLPGAPQNPNRVDGDLGTVGGGNNNIAGFFATIAGGANNRADGVASIIPGGEDNTASGRASFAAGDDANAKHDGAFVWSDRVRPDTSTGPNQFIIGARGGVGIGTNSPNTQLTVSGNVDIDGHLGIGRAPQDGEIDVNGALHLQTDPSTAQQQSARIFFDEGWSNEQYGFSLVFAGDASQTFDSTAFTLATNTFYILRHNNSTTGDIAMAIDRANGFVGFGVQDDATNPLTVGTGGSNGSGAFLSPGGAWTSGSSRNFKEDLRPIDVEGVLQSVIDLPLYRWRYKGSDEGDHMGPVAEDFFDAFELGKDERYISGVDGDGAALGAIQGLYKLLMQQQALLEQQQAQIARLGEVVERAGLP